MENEIFSKEEKKEWIKKLQPYWNKLLKVQTEFSEKIFAIEKRMNNELNPIKELSFFYVDGECVGIGAESYSERDEFPLIHDSDFDD